MPPPAGWRPRLPGGGQLIYLGVYGETGMNGAPFPEEAGLPTQDAPGLEAADLTSRDPRDAMSLQTAWLRSFLSVAERAAEDHRTQEIARYAKAGAR